jgi:hypothetical protein
MLHNFSGALEMTSQLSQPDRESQDTRPTLIAYVWQEYRLLAALVVAALLLIPIIGMAEERDMRREPYSSPNWQLDNRYSHDHYYPARGYVVPTLPPGYREIRYRNERYFLQGGVWIRAAGLRFIVVAPPPGVVVSVLPPAYSTVWIGPTAYWYANGVYYAQAPAGGYVVAPQPPGYESGQAVPLGPPPQQYAPLPPGYAPPR